MSRLYSQIGIGDVKIRNRIVVSPMCQYSSNDGFANDWHIVHLGSRAVGGAGIVFTEATAVSPEGRISPVDLGIWKDEHIDGLKRITSFIKQQGAVPGIQLAHAGGKASKSEPWKGGISLHPDQGGWEPIYAPSAQPVFPDFPTPKAMDTDDIASVIDYFTAAATRALQAGFQIVEIHAAHGYLIHEFLSPQTNQRVDQYGGSFENRSRLLIEIVRAVRTVWPEHLPLFVRLSATDWSHTGGWDLEQTITLAKLLKTEAVNLIDASSGGLPVKEKIETGPGYQVPFSERIRKEAGLLTGSVGLITSAEQAEEIVKSGKADLVFIGREFLRDPYFGLHAADRLGDEVAWPDQYLRAKKRH